MYLIGKAYHVLSPVESLKGCDSSLLQMNVFLFGVSTRILKVTYLLVEVPSHRKTALLSSMTLSILSPLYSLSLLYTILLLFSLLYTTISTPLLFLLLRTGIYTVWRVSLQQPRPTLSGNQSPPRGVVSLYPPTREKVTRIPYLFYTKRPAFGLHGNGRYVFSHTSFPAMSQVYIYRLLCLYLVFFLSINLI